MKIEKKYWLKFESRISMLCEGKSSTPSQPDPVATANAQGAANVETARVQGKLNNPSFSNPYGSRDVTYGANGDPDNVFVKDSLTPTGQKLFDTTNNINDQLGGIATSGLGRVSSAMATPFDTSNLTNRVTSIEGGDDAARQRIEQGLFDRQQPLLDRARTSRETQLSNMGITRGSEAWRNAEDDLSRSENDAHLATIAQAGNEQSRLFGMGQANADLANNQRSSEIQEQSYLRQLPLNEINALRTGNQVGTPQFQSFQGSGNIAPTDITGATNSGYNDALNKTNANNQQNAKNWGTAATIASAFISDRRAKEDIRMVGTTDSGLGVYIYRYKGEDKFQMGVMADEVEKIFPEAVVEREDGLKMVKYGDIQ